MLELGLVDLGLGALLLHLDGIEQAEAADDLAAVIAEPFGHEVRLIEIVVGQSLGPREKLFAAGHRVQARQRLELFAVDLDVLRRDPAVRRVVPGALPDVLLDAQHAVEPLVLAGDFHDRDQPILDVFGRLENHLIVVKLDLLLVLPVVRDGDAVEVIAQLLLGVQDAADGAVQRILIDDERGPAQERIAIGGGVAIVPVAIGDVQAGLGVDLRQGLLMQPALHLTEGIAGDLARLRGPVENRLVDLRQLVRRRHDRAAGAMVQQFLELVEVLLIDAARHRVVFDAQVRRPSDDLAHQPASGHHADRAQRLLRDADVASGHEQVRHVPRVQDAVGDEIRRLEAVVLGHRDERIVRCGLDVARVGHVQVDGPGGRHAGVGERTLGENVLAGEDHVAEEPSRFALARDERGPAKFVVGIAALGVLHRVPDAEHGPQIVVADRLGVGHRVQVEPGLPEPDAQAVQLARERLAVEVQAPLDAAERDRPVGLLDEPHVAGAHSLLGFHHPVGPGQDADRCIAGAIDEQSPRVSGPPARDDILRDDGGDPSAFRSDFVDILFHEQ